MALIVRGYDTQLTQILKVGRVDKYWHKTTNITVMMLKLGRVVV